MDTSDWALVKIHNLDKKLSSPHLLIPRNQHTLIYNLGFGNHRDEIMGMTLPQLDEMLKNIQALKENLHSRENC